MLAPSGSGVSLIEKLVMLNPVSLFRPNGRQLVAFFMKVRKLLTLHRHDFIIVYSRSWKSHLVKPSLAFDS